MTELSDLSLYAVLLALLLAVVGLLVGVRHYQHFARLREQLGEQAEAIKSQQNQISLLSESQREMGRQLIVLEERLSQLQHSQSSSPPQPGDKADYVISKLNAGSSTEQIASETGLDEVEISLLRQIHSARQQKT
jgi:hypothetical protein